MLRKLLQRLSRHAARRLVAEAERAEAAGRFDEACDRYQTALKFVPDYAPAYLGLGLALESGGNARAAREAYRSALEFAPEDASAHFNLGRLLHLSGNPASQAEAERELRAALERKPDFTDARVLLASVLEGRGDAPGAIGMLEAAVAQRPDAAGAWYNYALFLHRVGRSGEAAEAMRRTLDIWPDRADIWMRQGELLKALQRLPEAESALRRALELDAKLSAAYRLLASVLVDGLRHAEALAVLARGHAHDADGHSRAYELYLRNFDDAISAEELAERHRQFGREIERVQQPRFHGFAGTRDPERKLRIGFLSGDFRAHPVGWTFLPLIERLDRARYDPFCYSLSAAADDVTRAIAARAMRWHDVSALTQREIAGIINNDRIDVLVDLAGLGGMSPFEILASRPAPVQATWLGYRSTYGMARIDYRISDARADPPGDADRLHTEKLARLPNAQWCYRPRAAVSASSARNDVFTFGVFGQPAKLSSTARSLWAEVLKRAPESRMLIVGVPPGPATQALLEIAPGRVSVEPYLPLPDYLRRLGDVDLVLDPTPYSGATTTCDALWMGRPVLTLAGNRAASRGAASILGTLGLDEWIATSPEDYVEKAVAAARNGISRQGLRERMQASLLMNEAQFARDMEALWREMWRTWCNTVNS